MQKSGAGLNFVPGFLAILIGLLIFFFDPNLEFSFVGLILVIFGVFVTILKCIMLEAKKMSMETKYASGLILGFGTGLALGFTMNSVAIGVALGAGMGVTLGTAFKEDKSSLGKHKGARALIATLLGVLLFLGVLFYFSSI